MYSFDIDFGGLLMIEPFIPIIYTCINQVLGSHIAERERKKLAESTVKQALLGCYYEWHVIAEYAVKDEMLRKYAQLLTDISVKFGACGMLEEEFCNEFVEIAKHMMYMADFTDRCEKLLQEMRKIY